MQSQGLDKGLVIVLIIVGVLAATAVVVALAIRTDVVSEMIGEDEQLTFLLTVELEDGRLVTQAVYYEPSTQRGALFDIPSNTGVRVRSLDRVDSIDTIYFTDGVETYREEVSALLGAPLAFHLATTSAGFEAIVDAIEGVPIFVTNVPNEGVDAVLIPNGDVVLDGAKARLYLEYEGVGERAREITARHQKAVIQLLVRLGDFHQDLADPGATEILSAAIDSDLDRLALNSLFEELDQLESDRMITRQLEGTLRNVETGEESETLLFPHQEGKWLRESVRQVVTNLESEESLRDENIVIRVEVLNGTEVTGLAGRTAELYRSYGFDVVAVGNAEESERENTVVVDRVGNELFAQRAADIIRAPVAEAEEPGQSPVDVTIILGRDFDGRYVR
jgi:anionic cell wall polymer biosynthesis LytR-Cps2A-Psr (LCP) family protein